MAKASSKADGAGGPGRRAEGTILPGKVMSDKDIEFAPQPGRTSDYLPIFNQLGDLKRQGQWLVVPCPKETDIKTFQNRLNAALRRQTTSVAPEGMEFYKKTTKDGKAAIGLRPAREKKPRANAKK